MSIKTSITSRVCTDKQPGFHPYYDVPDAFGAWDGAPEPQVYLRLGGIAVQLEALNGGGARVTAAMPRKMARELGLLPSEDEPVLARDNSCRCLEC